MKTFRELQESSGVIPEENGFYEYPECYSVISDECHETLLLEDLKESKFEMIDHRTEPITVDHARLLMSALGKLHALSFALRDKRPDTFKEFASKVPEVLFRETEAGSLNGLKDYFDTLSPLVYGTLREDETELRQKLENVFADTFFNSTQKFVDGKAAEPYAVICHGDCWSNNILYKFGEVIWNILIITKLDNKRKCANVHQLFGFRIKNQRRSDFWTGKSRDMPRQSPISFTSCSAVRRKPFGPSTSARCWSCTIQRSLIC